MSLITSKGRHAYSVTDVLRVATQEDARTMVAIAVNRMLADEPSRSPDEAEAEVRTSIAYHAGRLSNEERAHVERVFECAHPIFGAIATNAPPTAEQALAMGMALGARERLSNDEFAALSYTMARVDLKRWHLMDRTGIHVRALGLHGESSVYDLAYLTRDSVLGWLRTRSPHEIERLVLMLLDHIPIEEPA